MNHAKNNIVFVDDDKNYQQFISATLGDEYNLHFVSSGEEYIGKLKKIPIDLVLLDDALPNMTGQEVCEYIKDDPITEHIPVIFISSIDDPGSRARAYISGCDDYLGKSVSSTELIMVVDIALCERARFD